MKVVILAGGSGERFWPLSTKETPKQFLKLFGGKTLIRQTFERLVYRVKPEDIFVVTSENFVDKTREELPEIPKENIIGEPYKRNTAAACYVGAKAAGLDEIVLTVPADHRIPDYEVFWKSVDKAVEGVKKIGGLFTFGITPTRPETGYGYIEAGEEIFEGVYEVKRFREKPNLETALDFLEKGNFYWNSGMFVWKGEDFERELKEHEPEIYVRLKNINPFYYSELELAYRDLKSISVDYAVMEKSNRVRMVKADFEWSDVGNWSSIIELEGYSSEKKGEIILVKSENVYVRKSTKKPIAVVGLKNIIVIESENGILVVDEEHVQNVRDVVKKLK